VLSKVGSWLRKILCVEKKNVPGFFLLFHLSDSSQHPIQKRELNTPEGSLTIRMEFSKPRDSPVIAMSYLGGNCVLYKVENTDAHVFVWGF